MVLSYLALIAGKSYVYDENELIENLQALLLLSSCAVFLFSLPGTAGAERMILLAGALFFLSLFLREVDVEKLRVPDIIILVGSGHGRNIILLSLWLIIFAYMLQRLHDSVNLLWALLFSRAGALYLAGGLFLVLGEVLESLSRSFRFQEEMSEVIGDYIIFIAVLYTPATLASKARAQNTRRIAGGVHEP